MIKTQSSLLGAGVLGDSFGSLADGVLGQLAGQQKAHGRLYFSAGDGGAAVVVCQAGGFGRDALEDIVDEGVHDAHGLAGNTCVRVDLLEHLVDVDAVALLSPPPALLVAGTCGFGLAGGLLGSLGAGFGWHVSVVAKVRLNMPARSNPSTIY